MAPTLNPDSYVSLQALHEAAQKNSSKAPKLSLPERPRNASSESAYSNAAIGMVSVYTAHLYNEHGSWSGEVKGMRQDIKSVDQKVDRFEQGATEALTDLSGRLNEVEEDLKTLKSQVKDVQSQVKDVQSQVKDVQSQVKDVQSQVKELVNVITSSRAIHLNSLRRLLDESIEPVAVLAPKGDKYVYTLSSDFPATVRDFWKLASNLPALVRLANHYSITGWERWQRAASDETDRTEYAERDLAIAAHPYRCLLALACQWGLQYSSLQRPRKRPADTDDDYSEVRHVRMRRGSGSEVLESIISQNEAGELTRQDRIIHVQPPQLVQRDTRLHQVLEERISEAQVIEQYHMPGRIRTSFESAELGWQASMRTKTTSSEGSKSRQT